MNFTIPGISGLQIHLFNQLARINCTTIKITKTWQYTDGENTYEILKYIRILLAMFKSIQSLMELYSRPNNDTSLMKYVQRMHLLLHNGAGLSFDSTNLNLSGDHSAEMVSSGVTDPDMLVSSMQNVSQAA